MIEDDVRDLLRREITPERYQRIRSEWTAHSLAEDQRDIPGLLATLTEDCLYEVVQDGYSWRGHEGAARFYTELLTAFPDIRFELRNIVIGPQGVWEEAHVTGTHQRDWLGRAATGGPVEFEVLIHFPWDERQGKFRGERIYYFGLA